MSAGKFALAVLTRLVCQRDGTKQGRLKGAMQRGDDVGQRLLGEFILPEERTPKGLTRGIDRKLIGRPMGSEVGAAMPRCTNVAAIALARVSLSSKTDKSR